MPKGKYGIPLPLYGILAFVLVLLNQTLILLLLSLFVVLAEQDDQTSRTVLEALSLQFIVNLLYWIIAIIVTLSTIVPILIGLVVTLTGVVRMAISLVSGGIAILGIIKAAKDEEPNFPILKDFANNLLMFMGRF